MEYVKITLNDAIVNAVAIIGEKIKLRRFALLEKNDDEMFWYFVIRFLAATGARVSELIQIKVEHVKLGHLDLYSKGGKLRRIYIPKELQKEALSWLAGKHHESGFLFFEQIWGTNYHSWYFGATEKAGSKI